MNSRMPGLGIVCAIILAGCTTANQQSIYRHTTVFDNDKNMVEPYAPEAVFIASDARSRGRTVVKVHAYNNESQTYAWEIRECRDIPPDVFTLMGASFQGGLSASGKPDPNVSANVANAIQESGRQIQRSQANALLNSIQEDHCALWQGGSIDQSQYMALSVIDLRLVAAISAIENISGMVEPAKVPSDLSTTAPKPPTQGQIEQASSEVDSRQKTADDLAKQAKNDLNGVTASNGNDPTCKDITDKKAESKCEKDALAAKSAMDALSTSQTKLTALKNLSSSNSDPKNTGSNQDPDTGSDNAPASNKQNNNPSNTQSDAKTTSITVRPVSDAVTIEAIAAIEDIANKAMNIDGDEVQRFVKASEPVRGASEYLRYSTGDPGALTLTSAGTKPIVKVKGDNRVTPRVYIQVSSKDELQNTQTLVDKLRYLFGSRMMVGDKVEVAYVGTSGFIRIYRQSDTEIAEQLQTIMTRILGHDLRIQAKYDWNPLPKPGLVELWLGTEDKVPALGNNNLIREAAAKYLLQ